MTYETCKPIALANAGRVGKTLLNFEGKEVENAIVLSEDGHVWLWSGALVRVGQYEGVTQISLPRGVEVVLSGAN